MKLSSSRFDMETSRLERPTVKNSGETTVGSGGGTNSTANFFVDISTGNSHNIVLSKPTTNLIFSNLSFSGSSVNLTLILRQDGFGNRKVLWPTSVQWQSNITPTLSSAPWAIDVVTLFTIDNGASWMGSVSLMGSTANRNLWSFGRNDLGQLGDGTIVHKSSPVKIGSLTNWAGIASSKGDHSIALQTSGTLWSWGYARFGQLGDGTTVNKSSPIQIGTLTDWSRIEGGREHSLALKTDGTLWAFGRNNYGQLGYGTTAHKSSPVQIGSLTDWASISCGGFHSFALKTDGTLWAFGRNDYGQLGDNTTVNRSSPIQIGSLTNWASVTGGWWHSLAIRTNGTLWTFGRNNLGQLGDNTTVDKSSPVQIGTLTDWEGVACGGSHSMALKTDGTLWSFGRNNFGQLGDGTTVNKSSPVKIGSLTDWASIACGKLHSLAVKTDGTLWTWGTNVYGAGSGQLGDGTTIHRSSPVQIGSLTNWAGIAGGRYHSIALKG